MKKSDSILIAGYKGMVGTAIMRGLQSHGFENLLLVDREELDLTRQKDVEDWFHENRPTYVFLCAAIVGGIAANIAEPARFIYDNLMIETNVINSAWKSDVEKLLFLGSSCIYPRLSQQPMKEEYMLTGLLEPTNEAYAIAKIAGLKLCEYYYKQHGFKAITIVPPNLYGPGDDFSPEKSHVIAALIRKFHEAKVTEQETVTIWGSGSARREFMYVEDVANIAIFLMDNYDSPQFINVGTNEDISIGDLANLIGDVVGYKGSIKQDPSKPDGMPRKLMDSSRFFEFSWKNITPLSEGLKRTYAWYKDVLGNTTRS